MLKIMFLCNVYELLINVLYNQIGYKYVSEKIFSNKHINIMYEELKKLTKKSNIVKEEHINNIKNNI